MPINPREGNQIMKDKALVAYHANCIDGITSAWVTCRALQKQGYEVDIFSMEYKALSVNDLIYKLSETQYNDLFVVDFSLDVHVLATLSSKFPGMITTILDHHKTAFEKYAPHMEVEQDSHIETYVQGAKIVLDNNESGASLCWNWFCDTWPLVYPNLVAYVKDHDLWRFDLGDKTKWVNKFLMEQEKTLENWDDLNEIFEDDKALAGVLESGKALQVDHDNNVERTAYHAAPITLQGIEGLAVACLPKLVSDVGHTLAARCETFGAMFSIDKGKQEVTWNLRSKGDFDVSAIAKKLGGGGHKNAAGFIRKLSNDIIGELE